MEGIICFDQNIRILDGCGQKTLNINYNSLIAVPVVVLHLVQQNEENDLISVNPIIRSFFHYFSFVFLDALNMFK